MSHHIIMMVLLVLLMNTPTLKQTEEENYDGPHIDMLIGQGKYLEAYDFLKAGVQKNDARQRISATYYAGFGKFFIEVGKPKDASQALKIAETASSQSGQANDFTAREMAAFQLMQGEYGTAASSSAKALRESSYRKTGDAVLAYCRSLEALARLRSGDLQRSEKLIRDALRGVPKGNNAEPLFAPRVFFAACVIESHRANYQEAQEFCRHGIEIVESKKIDSRDVSLGDLALAESYLLSGDLVRSRECAERSMAHTSKLFQPAHQDTVSALELLARVDAKEAKPADAQAHAKAALDMAITIFGEGTGGTRGPKQTLQEVAKTVAK
jgi:hypothetical protein